MAAKETNSLKLFTDEGCADAWKACFKNAMDHQEDAARIARPERYGSAITLLVLATEEYVKGMLYWLQSNHINIRNVKGIRLFFTDHIIRHRFASVITMCVDLVKEFMDMVYQLRDQLHDGKEPDWNAFQSATMNGEKEKMERLMAPMLLLMEWWDKANDSKNGGLYVGTIGKPGELETPDAFTSEQYEYAVEVVKAFALKLQLMIDYVGHLSNENKILFSKTVNKKGGILSVLEKLTETRNKEKNAKTTTIESIIDELRSLNRANL